MSLYVTAVCAENDFEQLSRKRYCIESSMGYKYTRSGRQHQRFYGVAFGDGGGVELAAPG